MEKDEPKLAYCNSNTEKPTAIKPTTNAADPNHDQLRGGRKDPTCIKPVTNVADPNRPHLLDENEDPRWMWVATDVVHPTRPAPKKDKDKPKRALLLKGNEEPISSNSGVLNRR